MGILFAPVFQGKNCNFRNSLDRCCGCTCLCIRLSQDVTTTSLQWCLCSACVHTIVEPCVHDFEKYRGKKHLQYLRVQLPHTLMWRARTGQAQAQSIHLRTQSRACQHRKGKESRRGIARVRQWSGPTSYWRSCWLGLD